MESIYKYKNHLNVFSTGLKNVCILAPWTVPNLYTGLVFQKESFGRDIYNEAVMSHIITWKLWAGGGDLKIVAF